MSGWHWTAGARSAAVGAALIYGVAAASAADPIKIGQIAALSGGSAQSGEAITRGLTLAIDEINAKGGLLGRPQARAGSARRRIEPAQGPDRGARAHFRGRRGDLRRHRYTRVGRHGAGAQQGKADLYGRLSGGNGDYPQWRRSELCLPRFRGRRISRRQVVELRARQVRRQESRPDADQQSLGSGQRKRPAGRIQSRSVDRDRRRRRNSKTTTSTWFRNWRD